MRDDLIKHDHKPIGTAETIEGLKALLQQLQDQQTVVDVALIDSEVPYSPKELPERFGAFAADLIRKALGESVTLVATTSTTDKYGDYSYNTQEGIRDRLGSFVTNLPAAARK